MSWGVFSIDGVATLLIRVPQEIPTRLMASSHDGYPV